MKVKILFVCHGNICRSPMAEFVMKKMVQNLHPLRANFLVQTKEVVEFEIASAATSTEEIGNPVYPPARQMLLRHGIDCSGKIARQMTAYDYEYYDYIVLMDENNLRNLRWILPSEIYAREMDANGSNRKISLLMDWTGNTRDVKDPWYTGDFQATWDDINAGCKAMLQKIFVSFQKN